MPYTPTRCDSCFSWNIGSVSHFFQNDDTQIRAYDVCSMYTLCDAFHNMFLLCTDIIYIYIYKRILYTRPFISNTCVMNQRSNDLYIIKLDITRINMSMTTFYLYVQQYNCVPCANMSKSGKIDRQQLEYQPVQC